MQYLKDSTRMSRDGWSTIKTTRFLNQRPWTLLSPSTTSLWSPWTEKESSTRLITL